MKTPEYQIIDGIKVSSEIFQKLQTEVEKNQNQIKPKLAFILVGDNPASLSYIKQKIKACDKIGFDYQFKKYEESIQEEELVKEISQLNQDPETHGIMVQLPLPSHINPEAINEKIDPIKDVDGFTSINLGDVLKGKSTSYTLEPCTPKGIIKLLQHYNIQIEGADAVVVGRSQIVGKPVAAMLTNLGATVMICHSKTKDLASKTSSADILIVATGYTNLITADMVKEGAVVVDVGFSKINNTIYGDVDFSEVAPKSSYITPVPGGVGPMTVACLMENLFIAYQNQNS